MFICRLKNIRGLLLAGAAIVTLLLLFAAGCEEEHRVELAAEPETGGSVEGAGSYGHEAVVKVEAEPAEGYVFAGWREDGEIVSAEESFQFEILGDRKLTAVFEQEAAYVTVELFFGDREAIETGVTGEYGYVRPVAVEMEDPEDPEVLLREALEELIKGPDPGEEELRAVVHDGLEILDVVIDPAEGEAEVDVCAEMFGEQWPGGSLPGTVFMQAVVLTSIQFPEVNAVIVTVEGEQWEDGHQIWDRPLGPDQVL